MNGIRHIGRSFAQISLDETGVISCAAGVSSQVDNERAGVLEEGEGCRDSRLLDLERLHLVQHQIADVAVKNLDFWNGHILLLPLRARSGRGGLPMGRRGLEFYLQMPVVGDRASIGLQSAGKCLRWSNAVIGMSRQPGPNRGCHSGSQGRVGIIVCQHLSKLFSNLGARCSIKLASRGYRRGSGNRSRALPGSRGSSCAPHKPEETTKHYDKQDATPNDSKHAFFLDMFIHDNLLVAKGKILCSLISEHTNSRSQTNWKGKPANLTTVCRYSRQAEKERSALIKMPPSSIGKVRVNCGPARVIRLKRAFSSPVLPEPGKLLLLPDFRSSGVRQGSTPGRRESVDREQYHNLAVPAGRSSPPPAIL